jgi:hypothetical protein
VDATLPLKTLLRAVWRCAGASVFRTSSRATPFSFYRWLLSFLPALRYPFSPFGRRDTVRFNVAVSLAFLLNAADGLPRVGWPGRSQGVDGLRWTTRRLLLDAYFQAALLGCDWFFCLVLTRVCFLKFLVLLLSGLAVGERGETSVEHVATPITIRCSLFIPPMPLLLTVGPGRSPAWAFLPIPALVALIEQLAASALLRLPLICVFCAAAGGTGGDFFFAGGLDVLAYSDAWRCAGRTVCYVTFLPSSHLICRGGFGSLPYYAPPWARALLFLRSSARRQCYLLHALRDVTFLYTNSACGGWWRAVFLFFLHFSPFSSTICRCRVRPVCGSLCLAMLTIHSFLPFVCGAGQGVFAYGSRLPGCGIPHARAITLLYAIARRYALLATVACSVCGDAYGTPR